MIYTSSNFVKHQLPETLLMSIGGLSVHYTSKEADAAHSFKFKKCSWLPSNIQSNANVFFKTTASRVVSNSKRV